MLNIKPVTKDELIQKYSNVSLDFLTEIRGNIIKVFSKFEGGYTTMDERCWENSFIVEYDKKAKANILTIRYVTWGDIDNEAFIDKMSKYLTMYVAHFGDILPNVVFKLKSKKSDAYNFYRYRIMRGSQNLIKI